MFNYLVTYYSDLCHFLAAFNLLWHLQFPPPPRIFDKYFKTSPRLTNIYKKTWGQAPKTPGAPLFSDPGSATVSYSAYRSTLVIGQFTKTAKSSLIGWRICVSTSWRGRGGCRQTPVWWVVGSLRRTCYLSICVCCVQPTVGVRKLCRWYILYINIYLFIGL